MRGFLQLTLDLFAEVVLPSSRAASPEPIFKPNLPLTPEEYAPVAINSGVIGEKLLSTEPAMPLTQVLRPTHWRHPRANREALLRTQAGKRAGEGGGECVVAYEFKRAKRKTIGFSIGSEGLAVSAPRWVPLYEVDKAVQEKAVWIVRKLSEMQERGARQAQAQIAWKEGAMLPFLGESVILVIDPRHTAGLAQLHSDASSLPGVPRLTLHLGLPHDASPERIRDSVQAWLMRQAKRVFEERLNHFAPLLGVRWTKLSLSSAESRWGSAGSDGAIRLNWRLIHFRQSVIDYVVVHELSHLRVMDHSPRFWSTVESILPDYAQRKGQLKDEAIPKW
jgi:predicted metal-dependent hydrolase